MSFKKYRIIDLIMLGILAVFAEAVGIGGVSRYFSESSPENFMLSLSIPIVLIAVFRWNYLGLIIAFLVGITTSIASSSNTLDHFVIYSIGNLGITIAILWFKWMKKDKIRATWSMTIIFYLTCYFSILITRSLIALVFGYNFISILTTMLLRGDVLSIVIGAIVIVIARRQPNLMVDMKDYLYNREKDVIDDGL